MNISRERQIGWGSSLLLHGLLILLFFFLQLPDLLQPQEFVEVSWGATATPSVSTTATSSSASLVKAAAPAVKPPVKIRKAAQPVVPPERRSPDFSDEVLRMPKTDKIDVPETGTKARPTETKSVGERDVREGQNVGERERATPGSTTGGGPGGASPVGSSGVGDNVDRGTSYSIQWLDGGTRRKIAGNLPKYPEGVNVEAQIKIMTVVMPDGSVKAVQPEQKANTRLEDAAMKEVRLWRFEPLRSNQPQLEQNAVITFLFKLK